MIEVRAKYTFTERPTDFVHYIGRPSPLGNPFVIGRDGDRATVIARYRKWLETARVHKAHVRQELQLLRAMADSIERGIGDKTTLVLLCHCSPEPCHGHILKEILEADLDQAA